MIQEEKKENKILSAIITFFKKTFILDKSYLIGISIVLALFILDIILAYTLDYQTAHKYTYEATPYVVALSVILILYFIKLFASKKKSATDLTIVVFTFFAIWDVAFKLGWITNDILVPSPEGLFNVFYTKHTEILTDIWLSLKLLFWGFLLGIVLGTVLGLVAGWFARVREVVIPISNAITLLPPLLFSAYLIMTLDTFKQAAIAVIFFAVFWPTLQGTVARVSRIDKKIIEAAKVMGVGNVGMLFKVIFPYCLPEIIKSVSKSLRGAFMCLAGAEMLGINGGVGFFIEKYKSFADFRVVLAGIVTVGVVTTVIDLIVTKVEKALIKWNY